MPRAIRDVQFHPEDSETTRWQALGLVVASLTESSLAPPESDGGAANSDRLAPSPREVWMDVGGALGRGLDRGALRSGGWITGGYRAPRLPWFVGVGASFGGGAGGADVTATWEVLTAQLGAVLHEGAVQVALRPRLGVVFERLGARTPPAPGASGSRWLGGTTFGVDLLWPARATLSLVAGADATWLVGGTAIRLDGREIASFPALGWQALLGVQVTFSSKPRPRAE